MRRPILLLALLAGCAARPASAPAPATPLLGEQLRQQDEALIGKRFRTLLDFETPADATFVHSPVALPAGNVVAGHTGRQGFVANTSASIDVSSLLFGLKLPGEFTLLGGYVQCARSPVTVALEVDGRTLASTTRTIPPGAWAFVAVDLTGDACRRLLPTAGRVSLNFGTTNGSVPGQVDALLLDDVLLVDNRQVVADGPGGWSVARDGLSIIVTQGGARRAIPSVAATAGGWAVTEAGPLRLRLTDTAGRPWTLLPDGRSIINGRPESPAGIDRSDGEITVDDATGRVDRETPGDADNDGYNEARAAYQIVATAGRLRFRFSPNGTAVSPVFEIHGLPPEDNVVTAGGRLIDRTARLSDGTLLVTLPTAIDAPVEVTVGVGG